MMRVVRIVIRCPGSNTTETHNNFVFVVVKPLAKDNGCHSHGCGSRRFVPHLTSKVKTVAKARQKTYLKIIPDSLSVRIAKPRRQVRVIRFNTS